MQCRRRCARRWSFPWSQTRRHRQVRLKKAPAKSHAQPCGCCSDRMAFVRSLEEIQPKPTLTRRHGSRFRRSKGPRARRHDHTRRSGQKDRATAAFSRRRKKRVSGTENDPETVGVSRAVDGSQARAPRLAGLVVDDVDLRSSQRSLEPPSSMRTRPPAYRCGC